MTWRFYSAFKIDRHDEDLEIEETENGTHLFNLENAKGRRTFLGEYDPKSKTWIKSGVRYLTIDYDALLEYETIAEGDLK